MADLSPPLLTTVRLHSWTQVDESPNRYLIGDIYGKLLAVEVVRSSSGKVAALQTRDLGDVSF